MPITSITTTCDRPEVDTQIANLIGYFTGSGLPIREATEKAARKAADAAEARGWPGDAIDFVVIRTADLGSRIARETQAA